MGDNPLIDYVWDGDVENAIKLMKYAKPEDVRRAVKYADKYLKYEDAVKLYEVAKPRIQEYIMKTLGIEMPLELQHGWTDKLKELVKDITVDSWDKAKDMIEFFVMDSEDYMRGVVSRQRMLKMLPYTPVTILFDRQNDAPLFLDLIDVKCNDVYYETYIITKIRWDERITIDGVYLPIFDCDLEARNLLHSALAVPDEIEHIRIGDKVYLRMWWD